LRAALHRVEELLIALILGVMTVLTFVQVVLRYGFNSGFIWALEADFYLFAWMVLLGISYCVRERAHIGVDAATRLLSPAPRRIFGLIVVALTLLYAGLMLYGSWVYVDKLIVIDIEAEDIPIKRWILSLCLPIGFALLFIRLLGMGWRIWTGQSPGYELADEGAEAIKDVTGDKVPDATTVSR
jgi:C4-dicarboxylate transporter, DctQ subunit